MHINKATREVREEVKKTKQTKTLQGGGGGAPAAHRCEGAAPPSGRPVWCI